ADGFLDAAAINGDGVAVLLNDANWPAGPQGPLTGGVVPPLPSRPLATSARPPPTPADRPSSPPTDEGRNLGRARGRRGRAVRVSAGERSSGARGPGGWRVAEPAWDR